MQQNKSFISLTVFTISDSKVIQDKVDIIGVNYIKCSGAWAVILKAIAFFA